MLTLTDIRNDAEITQLINSANRVFKNRSATPITARGTRVMSAA